MQESLKMRRITKKGILGNKTHAGSQVREKEKIKFRKVINNKNN